MKRNNIILPKTKKAKVEFLKALQRGDVSLNDLHEKKYEVVLHLGPNSKQDIAEFMSTPTEKGNFNITLNLD